MIEQNNKKVRNLFYQELLKIQNHGVCLLPEWICNEMARSAILAGWEIVFYRVEKFNNKTPFLTIDKENFEEIIKKLSFSGKLISIVFSHPWGYIDPTIIHLMKLSITLKCVIHLDLAQSYGVYNFQQQIRHSYITYFSFNGNKLINFGGALRIKGKDKEEVYKKIQLQFKFAAEEQKKRFNQTVLNIKKRIGLDILNTLKEVDDLSNYNRVIIHDFNCIYKRKLETYGFGQLLLKNPQEELKIPSVNYLSWYDHCFLLFPEQRIATLN